jgi:hypothetical protein
LLLKIAFETALSPTITMPETWSVSSSCASSISFEEVPAVMPPSPRASTDSGVIKFLCSYGGKILPRRHDSKLRYVGGHTRVLTIHRPHHFHGTCAQINHSGPRVALQSSALLCFF